MLALLAAVVLSQTVYEWTDAQGEQHFTDDLSTIPKGVKVRTTSGEPIMVVPATPKQDASPTTTRDPGPDKCEAARQRVVAAEQQREKAKAERLEREAKARAACQARLATHGRGAYAVCLGSVEQRAGGTGDAPQDRELDDAREALRRAQVGGCR